MCGQWSSAGHSLKGANTSHILTVTRGDLFSDFTNLMQQGNEKSLFRHVLGSLLIHKNQSYF